MKPEISTEIKGKWIVLSSGGKSIRFRRSGNQGIILESLLNNNNEPVSEELLVLALKAKTALPKIK